MNIQNEIDPIHCEKVKGCTGKVTHIASKGYLYCANHRPATRVSRTLKGRTLKGWEIALLEAGEPVPSYKPISQKAYLASKKVA